MHDQASSHNLLYSQHGGSYIPSPKANRYDTPYLAQEPLRRDLWREVVFSRRGGDRGDVIRIQGSLK